MRIGTCIACQHGNHDSCTPVIQYAPSGVMGGARCGCEGDCRERYEARIAAGNLTQIERAFKAAAEMMKRG